jgi:lysozyme family protein
MTLTDFIRGFTFPHECAYAPGHNGDMNYVVTENVPNDAGGATKYGIDQASHPEINIEGLTAADAENIYKAEFAAVHWSILGNTVPALTEFPAAAALAFFDCREVCGAHAAWICTQRALNLTPDGVPGPDTRNSILAASDLSFALVMIDERRAFHRRVVVAHPEDAGFLRGWLNRCDDLGRYLSAPGAIV